MKKFLSICLVALCSVSAMYAQTTPTPDVKTQNGVECGSTVTVSATSVNKHFNFDHWEIKKDDGSSIATINPGDNNATYNATSGQTQTESDGRETNVLTVNPLNHNLIDLVSTATNIGTLTFEAFFTEENWYIINAAIDNNSEGLGTVSQDPTDGKVYHDETIKLTANPADDCIAFVGWKDETGTIVSTAEEYTVSPDPNWQANSLTPHTYKAVFAKKKVNIKVTTADNTKGTVAIVPASAGN